jgi:hypothetical protein
MKKRKFLLASLLAGFASLAPLSASANTIEVDPFPLSTFVTPDGSGGYTYRYTVSLTIDSTITDDGPRPSQFTIYDVSALDFATVDFQATTAGVGDFTFSLTTPSYWPVDLIVANSSGLVDLTGTYVGDDFTAPLTPRTELGILTFKSTVGTTGPLQQTSYDISPSTGAGPSGPRPVLGPVESPGGPPLTPLPAAAWAGMGLFGLLGAKKFRKKKQ